MPGSHAHTNANPAPSPRPAVFLDRDGTIIEAVHYLSDPAKVRLLTGASDAIRALRAAGFACVVVTNQSAVGRGMLSVERLMEVQAEVDRQLALHDTQLDAFYYCPAVPASEDRTATEHPERKPAPGMLVRAAQELGLDLKQSWMVGDMVSDVLAGRNAGCRGSLFVACGQGRVGDLETLEGVVVVANLAEAAHHILSLL
jgi:D-glycero-D-manno-heptose 1,7-bisphosphate phosphatase